MATGVESMILRRVIRPDSGGLPPEFARFLLGLDFPPEDHTRIAELSAKAQEGSLSSDETEELDSYLHVNDLIVVLQSKARRSLSPGT